MNKVDQAVSYFKNGNTCSQAVFSTYATEFGVDEAIALKIACPFGGGMSRMGKTCGAVTGAFMVLGLKYGRINVEDELAREKTYNLVIEFVNRFKSRNNTIECEELIGCSIDTPEKLEIAKEKGIFENICPQFVKDAAEILEEIL